MSSWYLLTILGIPAIGVLAFLRVTTNEVERADRAVKAKQEEEAAREPPPESDDFVAERAG
jgi:hypothetical protein